MPKKSVALTEVLARRSREQRLALGLTQEAVAERLGMALRHYQKIEGGELNVTLKTVERLAIALKTTAADLVRIYDKS